MTPAQRIRLARRHANLSQAALGSIVGVQRSSVSHWEAMAGKLPSARHLRDVAMATGVQFEWLATGRGRMGLSRDASAEPQSTADACVVDDPMEMRLLAAFRDAPALARAPLVELAEQLAAARTGRSRVAPDGRSMT